MKICIGSVLLLCLVRNSLAQDHRPNLALGKPTAQYLTHKTFNASIAVNGRTDNCGNVFTHTENTGNPWWIVNLQQFARNAIVKVFPRSGYGGKYRVSISNSSWDSINPPYTTCGEKEIAGVSGEIVCQGIIGRFVRVQRIISNFPLCLCEVEVRGDGRNRARQQTALQISTLYNDVNEYGPQIAVDGILGGKFTHTYNNDSKWWLVHLKGQILIYKFIITPRRESGANYGGNFSAIVRNSSQYDSPFDLCRNQIVSSTTTEVNCTSVLQGSYAGVFYYRDNFPLCMYEVEVYGYCAHGYHGSQCDEACPANCEGPCIEDTGNCIRCLEGRWGAKCGNSCRQTCRTCDQSRGTCVSCVTGFWGPQCENTCGKCLDRTCNKTNGYCLGNCTQGYHGSKCNQTCPQNCDRSSCRKDGECLGCKQGFWGALCHDQCGNCVDGTCRQNNASCPSACKSGFYGTRCNNSCPDNCREETCLQQDGSCTTCDVNYFGTHCNSTCPMNCHSTCNKDTGRCDGCLPGTWGTEYCNKNCSDNCDVINDVRPCNRETGRCKQCPKLFWGDKCDNRCFNCSKFPCARSTGHCSSCEVGFHGKPCDKACSTNCSGGCDQDTAICRACVQGYHGGQCSTPCPNFCSNNRTCFQGNGSCVACSASRYGATCQETCGKGCEGGVCDRYDGTCTCSSGYAKPKCQKQDVQNHSGSPPSGVAIGGGVGGVLFVLVLILLVIIWVRKGKPFPGRKASPGSPMRDFSNGPLGRPLSKEVPQSHLYNDPEPVANPAFEEPDESAYVNLGVQVSHLPDYIMHLRQRDTGFEDEFKGIPTNPVSSIDYGRLPQHVPKNRFRNIIPYDNNRVRLLAPPDDDENDYVNASYIMAYNKEKNFIAAQGPNSVSFDDFIKLLWEQNVPLIIMVTKVEENKKTKCEKYWPDLQQTWNRGGVKLTTLREEQLPHYSIRTIRMRKDGEVHEIEQLQYTAWPDHGVPECPASFLDFVQKAKKLYRPEVGPALVHCSAGVGRTGTFLAVDYLLEQAKAESRVEVQGVVTALRKQRINMVQSMDQYKFIYEALVEALHCGQTVYPVTSYRTITGQDLQRQFQILNKLTRIKTSADNLSAARDPSNQSKNRDAKVLPSNQSRPFLMTQVSGRNDYINAVFTKSYAKNDKYIVTQTPLPDTIVDFWRLVYDYTCGTIISLNRFNTPGCPAYWAKAPCRYGPFRVECVSEENNGHMIMRTLKLTIKEEERRVQQFEVTTWDSDVPPTTSLQVLVEDHTRALSADDKILVHCLDGCERSGVFCAFVHVCDKITEEHEVDVFHAVKKIREGRPEFITSQMQYQWLHDAARDYISSFDTYANFK